MSDFLKRFRQDRQRDGRGQQDESFVQNVLARTSGSACERALGLLPELADHQLGDLDRQLVQAHLEHCPGCRRVAVTLGWLGELLPAMAEVDPGPAFTEAVLARTSRALSPAEKAVRAGQNIGPAGWLDRLGRWWQRQLEKPQFALQFAYVATVVILALTATPWSPLRQAPEKALTMVQAGPGSIPVVNTLAAWGEAGLDRALGGVREKLDHSRHRLGDAWAERNRRSLAARQEAGQYLDSSWNHLREGALTEAGYEGWRAARRGGAAWSLWWRGPENGAAPDSLPEVKQMSSR